MDLVIERAVAGGRMLARHEGAIVLVAGAIPGERVRVRVERPGKRMLFARVDEVLEPSPARRLPVCDPSCGGMDYAHMAYATQLECKREVVRDAMRRIGRVTLDDHLDASGSPEEGYRLRARLHVAGDRAGFFREGTHTLCDAAATRQLMPETVPAVERVLAAAGAALNDVASVVVAENVAATERVVHLESRKGSRIRPMAAAPSLDAGLTGVTAAGEGSDIVLLAGSPHVTDSAAELFGSSSPVPVETTWTRQAASFFQGNRFLVGALAAAVTDAVHGHRVADLYAGVGLFAVTLAASGRAVVAVEGDRVSGRDLRANASPFGDRLHVSRRSVEDAVAAMPPRAADTVIVDPPRTGVSPEALRGIVGLAARRVVYVSCDPATLARDAAEILKAGYALDRIRLFDLFPNTSHVETLAVFSRGRTMAPA
jgi:23S rRNA (uracil1939-C5)-methyltransferase